MLKQLAHAVGRAYIRRIVDDEAETQKFRRHNERPIEFAFVFEKLGELRPRTVLDVGTGTTALPSLIASCGSVVTAVDNVKDYWPKGMTNRHWKVIDDDIKASRLPATFDMVTCISVLEHIEDHVTAVRGLVERTRCGGHIVLTTPYNEEKGVPNVYQLAGAAYGADVPYICRSSCRADLDQWLACGLEIVEQRYWQFWSGDVWTQGHILPMARSVTVDEPHQLTCLLLRKLDQTPV